MQFLVVLSSKWRRLVACAIISGVQDGCLLPLPSCALPSASPFSFFLESLTLARALKICQFVHLECVARTFNGDFQPLKGGLTTAKRSPPPAHRPTQMENVFPRKPGEAADFPS